MIATRRRPAEPKSIERFSRDVLRDYQVNGSRALQVKIVLKMLRVDVGIRTAKELEDDDIVSRLEKAFDARGVSGTTRRLRHATFNAIVRRAYKSEMLDRLPSTLLNTSHSSHSPRGERSTAPEPREVSILFGYLRAADSWRGRRLHALAAVVTLAGIPVTGALRLPRADIDLDQGLVWVRRPWRESVESARTIPYRISEELKAILADWFPRTKCKWAFPGTRRAGPWETRHPSSSPLGELSAACAAAGIKPLTFEKLRRYSQEYGTKSVPIGAQVAASPAAMSASETTLVPSIKIGGPKDPVFVRGKPMCVLSDKQYEITTILLKSFPGTVTMAEIEDHVSSGGWLTTLRRLACRRGFERTYKMSGYGHPGKTRDSYGIYPW